MVFAKHIMLSHKKVNTNFFNMKKIFSLVALVGMFALMSFSFNSDHSNVVVSAEKAQPTWCDSVHNACLGAAEDTITYHDFSVDDAVAYYDLCTSMNGC